MQSSPKAGDPYIPGVCNINSQEIARRRTVAYVGAIIFIVALLLLIALRANHWIRLILFPAGYMTALGSLQAKYHFCSGYGARGKQNAREGSATPTEVIDETALARDKRRSRQLNWQAAAYGAILTLLSVIIPAVR